MQVLERPSTATCTQLELSICRQCATQKHSDSLLHKSTHDGLLP